ncbi:MAG: hypothetical protein ACFCBW_20570 [Candidatus Competibacterales bacterium]
MMGPTMHPFDTLRHPSSAEALAEALFHGQLLTIGGIDVLVQLQRRACQLVEAHFGPDPEVAEQHLCAEDFRRLTREARKAVANDPTIDDLWRQGLMALGYPPTHLEDDTLRRDRMLLRIVPSQVEAQSRVARCLPAHRDSWASGIMAQINWWMPLYPLAETRTLVIWPEAFRTPVANTAAEWDYDALLSGRHKDYPRLPQARIHPQQPPLPVVIEPGTLLAFASAHLHASTSDASGITRFSLDTRTVWLDDVAAGRGAPDVDGAGRPPRWEMFARRTAAAR